MLEGSIRRAGNRLRITAQLVETRTRHSAWAERYDREIEDVFAIQDEIARSIAQALRVTLTPQEDKTIGKKATENLQAYDYYLRGRSYTRRENFDFALQMYEQAIKLDPNFALAHAGVGNICGLIFELREQSQKWIERGLTACDRALALDDQAPEVLVARARVFYAQKRYDEAVRYAQRAIDRKPDCEGAYNILGRALFSSDRSQEAAAIVERALEANGDDYNTYIPYANALMLLGRKEEAERVDLRLIDALERQLELVPDDVRARILLSSRYAGMKRADDATRHLADRRGAQARRQQRPVQRGMHVRPARDEAPGLRHVPEGRRSRLRQQGVGGSRHGSGLPPRHARVPIAGGTPRDDVAGAVRPWQAQCRDCARTTRCCGTSSHGNC